ncbi:hypothetical protein LTR91_026089 [Friedmanniomyces endolithicus]|uniref:Major facilitator superfamily (MFS) profile domain-containing protein n=1 Tax=Friedmanniomyces endolithicus TaxID=329885 RepID=A0AAN6JVC7_9PEZI|nr:hypothetical protein LTR03_017713 [Friedmanniomyces endolithicus]KAK0886921.1 hypothetical protein LTR02_017706 [Friedmanniomyces endolithicus]KAK0889239.1 hypothetical protein LTR57_025409 [Friedmanniomyces endolithicus]KAK0949889.1 hypothetical protein LTR91_026089 [Friedmanniomyces endolithicus]KAK1021122.1 hypothetical protein LTS16_026724 [Friedmanniomyces endolithicus]
MDDKLSHDVDHDEKKGISPTEPDMVETGGRRGSVALNIVENPLTRSSHAQTVADAQTYAEKYGMPEHAALFGRAALVARDPDSFERLQELDETERAALNKERDHKWHGPFMLWYAISLCAIGAATQGWDQTGSNGANLSFPEEFGIHNGTQRDEWLVGLVNAIIFLTAGLIGAFIVDPLNHYLGRRGEIFLTACGLTATPIGSAFTHSWQALFAARFVMGIGIGAKNATVPIYSAEVAPHRIRGALVMFWQLWVVIEAGAHSFQAFSVASLPTSSSKIPARSHGVQLGSAFIPSFILMCGIWFCPESPRWLMKNGKHAKAFKWMDRLRAHPIIAARDYYYSYVLYNEELKLARGANYFTRLWDCFAVPRIRRANYGASTVMLAQQMCGINIISFYSSTIFTNVGYSPTQALYASLGYGAIQVVFTIPTLFLIDTKGRRTLTLITFPLMCIFLLAAGLSLLKTEGSQGARIGPVVLFVCLFTIMYSLGEGPVAFQYSAEVFPTIQREQGMAWAVCTSTTHSSASTPGQSHRLGHDLLLCSRDQAADTGRNRSYFTSPIFAARIVHRPFHLTEVFSVPTKEFLDYETGTWLPYFIKRHILRRKIENPPPIIARDDRRNEKSAVLGG